MFLDVNEEFTRLTNSDSCPRVSVSSKVITLESKRREYCMKEISIDVFELKTKHQKKQVFKANLFINSELPMITATSDINN